MPNDAKLGLVIGMGLVIAVAVVFFRKDLVTAKPAPEKATSVAVGPATPPPVTYPRTQYRTVRARTAPRGDATLPSLQHTVREGETLFSLAQRYYGDGDRFVDLYRVNRQVVKTPDQLTPGTVLVIPEVSEEAEEPAAPAAP